MTFACSLYIVALVWGSLRTPTASGRCFSFFLLVSRLGLEYGAACIRISMSRLITGECGDVTGNHRAINGGHRMAWKCASVASTQADHSSVTRVRGPKFAAPWPHPSTQPPSSPKGGPEDPRAALPPQPQN